MPESAKIAPRNAGFGATLLGAWPILVGLALLALVPVVYRRVSTKPTS